MVDSQVLFFFQFWFFTEKMVVKILYYYTEYHILGLEWELFRLQIISN